MPMEHEQQPMAAIVIQPMRVTFCILQFEWHRRLANLGTHKISMFFVWFSAKSDRRAFCLPCHAL
jgi:hypothetical protein